MFLKLPVQHITTNIHNTVFILNTVILIIALIVVELVYAETPKKDREHLKYFAPLFLVLIGLLIYAAYKQAGVAS